MPDYEVALPTGAYQLNPNLATFTRTGIDGAEVILPVFGGDNFIGEVLAGKWQIMDDSDILANGNQGVSAQIITNFLELTAASHAAGTSDYGWIVSRSQLYMLDDTTLVVELVVPAAVSASRHVSIELDLVNSYPTGNDPQDENEWLKIQFQNNDGAYRYKVRKSVGNVESDVIAWTTTTYNYIRVKLVFRETKAGYNNTAIYLDDGEKGFFVEDSNSPFALGLLFNTAYPVLCMETNDATQRIVTCEDVTVNYPDFQVKYALAVTNEGKGTCKCFDTMGSADEADWVRVFDVDHVFTGDCVIQNGLARIMVDEGTVNGVFLYHYLNGTWDLTSYEHMFYFVVSAVTANYPYLSRIVSLTTEQVCIEVKWCEDAAEDDDYYVTTKITLRRGSPMIEFWPTRLYPTEYMVYYISLAPNWNRFCYVGDPEASGVGDDDLAVNATNTTFTDNFTVLFDDEGDEKILVVSSRLKPSQDFITGQGRNIYYRYLFPEDLETARIFVGVFPFAGVANLFKEAEDGSLEGGADSFAAGGDSGGLSARLDAQSELVRYYIPVDGLPVGRYMALMRVKDTNQVNNDVMIWVYNDTEGKYRNATNATRSLTATASWKYWLLVFDILEADSGDTLHIGVLKDTADANAIYVDYFLIVPVGNGEIWPIDLAHNAMRLSERDRKVFLR